MDKKEICECFYNGLSFLLLGQEFIEKNAELLIDAIEKKFLIERDNVRHNFFFKLDDVNRLQWIQDKEKYLVPTPSQEVLCKFPWNSVICSSPIDLVTVFFQKEGRETYPITSVNPDGNVYLNHRRLTCAFLFGRVDDDSDNSRPPVSKFEFLQKKLEAVKILSVYSKELLSPYGVVFIDGYNYKNDWLQIEDLAPVFANYGKGQVQYFGGSLRDNDTWNMLCENGIIEEHKSQLPEFLLECQAEEYIDLQNIALSESEAKLVSINGKNVKFPFELYSEYCTDLSIVDDSVFLLPIIKEEELYNEYKYFLYESGNTPVWSGLRNGFDFEREITNKISAGIDKNLNAEIGVNPIIIHGQAGCGKSVILARLAYNQKVKKKYPILYIPRYASNPSKEVLSNLSKWFEEHGAKKTLIFWDGNFYNDEINIYCEMIRYLISLGRNVVLIGTAHKLADQTLSKFEIDDYAVDSNLTDIEISNLSSTFHKFSGVELSEEKIRLWNNESIVVALYRMLPATRNSIRSGVVEEAAQNVKNLASVLIIKETTKNTPFEKLFLDAGIITEPHPTSVTETYDFSTLLNYVCVPAQFGIYVPLSIVLDCMDCKYSVEIGKKIDEIDFFRIIQCDDGEFLVNARSSLEAQIVIKSKICSVEDEVKILEQYIDCLAQGGSGLPKRRNIDFVVSLLKAFGPNGEKTGRYKRFYLRISRKLKNIREKGIDHLRLVLQEVSFIREYIKESEDTYSDKMNLFKEAQELLVSTEQKIRTENIYEQQRGWILCELAANYGSQLQIIHDNHRENIKELLEKYNLMIGAVRLSRGVLIDSFYALDVCAWGSSILLKDETLSEEQRMNIYSNVMGIYEQAGISSPGMLDLKEYNNRLILLADQAKDLKVGDEVFKRLLACGQMSGIYLRTRKMIKDLNFRGALSDDNVCICKSALNYLNSFFDYENYIRKDIDCSYLRFKLLWAVKAKEPMMFREKTKLKFTQSDWNEIYLAIEQILNNTPDCINANLKYIRFIALFHLDRIDDWKKSIQEIQHINYPYDKRVIINYIASDEHGMARKYSGEVESPITEKRVMLYITELKTTIPCFVRSFVEKKHYIGEKHKNIELGFNFLGVQVCRVSDTREGI